jgi:glycosyltransferase involved in cell wall biosynthesis
VSTTLLAGVDVSPLDVTRAGTSRYITGLLGALAREDGLDLRRYRFGGAARVLRPVRDVVWYLAALPLLASRHGIDVLHCPSLRAPIRCPVPLVVSIHDLALLRYPQAFNRWTRTYSALALPRIARAARAIVVGSEFARSEVVELLGAPSEEVHVIPYGVGAPFRPDGPAAEGDYALAVSTLEPRKNLPRLIDGFRRARLDGCELRVVGARGWGSVEVAGENVHWLGEVPDDELARLYRGARCVAYVSLYEGFGLPVLEAMACGAAVVAPAGPPYAEFAHGVAVEVDPNDAESIAFGLVRACEGREELGARGPERAAQFTWGQAARRTLDVYRGAATRG